MRYMSGGKFNIPLVIRTTIGSGVSGAAQHSQNLHALFMHIPGLQLVVPSTPYNVKGLLKTAIRNDNPVIFIEHQLLYKTKGFIPKKEYTIPFGKANIKRKGKDVTVIATLNMVNKAVEAGKLLEKIGISIEIIDLQTLVPYDKNTVIESVKKTSKLVIVSEGCKTGGEGAEIAAMIAEDAFEYLKAPIKRVAAYDVPIPFNPNLEKYVIPDINDIVTAIKDLVRK
jgi:pyruvate dehydrogenase E1 component beta subunit